jgi:hypothetical protein
MAKVAKKWLVWHSDPKLDAMGVPLRNEMGELIQDRVEILMDSVVPDTVPLDVQEDWEARDLVFEDPTKEHIAVQEGPPRMTLPPILTQKMEQAKKMSTPGVHRMAIPPRPISPIPKT